MQLLIVRHADAGDAEDFAKTGQPDSLRPLSAKGRKQMRRVAAALRELVPDADLVVTSPLTRAVETHDFLIDAYKKTPSAVTSETLEPDREPDEFARWLAAQKSADVVVAVGHEPHLSGLVTWLLFGSTDARVQLKKAGACLLQFDERPQKGAAQLRWLLTAKQLEAFASTL